MLEVAFATFLVLGAVAIFEVLRKHLQPTRKMMAVVIAGVFVGGILAVTVGIPVATRLPFQVRQAGEFVTLYLCLMVGGGTAAFGLPIWILSVFKGNEHE